MNRAARLTQILSIVLIVVALLWMGRTFPLDQGITKLHEFVRSVGAWGPAILVLVYAAATVLFVPGSALTLASGAIFGLALGTVVVSLGSTLGAALAFLAARYLAREKVAGMIEKNPKFDAIDRAIGRQGWKIVALLRLSPAVPFNLQNYLYGLTAIGFWPCVLSSWAAMLPGTFMYVYFGYLAGAGAQVLARGGDSGDPGRWIMTVVGLLATVAVTIYVTRLAGKAIKLQASLEDERILQNSQENLVAAGSQSWPRSATLSALVAVLLLGGAAWANLNRDQIQGLFGPPAVALKEQYRDDDGNFRFDHSLLDELLEHYVAEHGWVDYEGLSRDASKLDRYVASIAEAPFERLGRSEKLALLINAYNAFSLRLILDHWSNGDLLSIQDIPAAQRWDDQRWKIGARLWSLNQIEHEEIRPKFIEPRVHFALVCAAIGCPKLRNEAYQAGRIEQQLEDQARYIHSHGRWFRFDASKNIVYLTPLYDWYAGDFGQAAGSVLDFAARYSAGLKKALRDGTRPTVRWLEYDWRLNHKANAD